MTSLFTAIDAPVITEQQVYEAAGIVDLSRMLASGYSLRGISQQVQFKIDEKKTLYCLFRDKMFVGRATHWSNVYEGVLGALTKGLVPE